VLYLLFPFPFFSFSSLLIVQTAKWERQLSGKGDNSRTAAAGKPFMNNVVIDDREDDDVGDDEGDDDDGDVAGNDDDDSRIFSTSEGSGSSPSFSSFSSSSSSIAL